MSDSKQEFINAIKKNEGFIYKVAECSMKDAVWLQFSWCYHFVENWAHLNASEKIKVFGVRAPELASKDL